jgi:predicted transposase YdaD
VAAVPAALLLGSSSKHWKFNSDHFTFLKFEGQLYIDMDMDMAQRLQSWLQFYYYVAAVTAALVAAWLPGSSSMYSKSNSHHFFL